MGVFSTIKQIFNPPKVDYAAIIAQGGVVVDVRSKAEFKSGHVKGSTNIPLNVLSTKAASLKGKEVVLVCKSGMRAAQAKSFLSGQGIVAHNAGAWQNL